MNFENLFSYSTIQYQVVEHILLLGAAIHLCALVYFYFVGRKTAPKYQLASTLSILVMVSAAAILYSQYASWRDAFVWDAGLEKFVSTDALFSNGFRYANWSIDVPLLLLQMVVLLGIAGAKRAKIWAKFTVAGLLMIWTGYIGQFYETDALNFDGPFWIWNGISWVFYVYIIWVAFKLIFKTDYDVTDETRKTAHRIFLLFLFAWTLYPIAYAIPAIPGIADNAWYPVARQIIFTSADVLSKVLYGVMITHALIKQSAAEGYKEAKVVSSSG